jgi:methyl-accepting chemotaxis protein
MKVRSSLTVLILMAISPSLVMAGESCSKKAAEEKIKAVCESISSKGKDAQKDWPEKLLYKNCGDNYVWIQDTNADVTMIMHPVLQRLNGQSLKDKKDDNGFVLFSEFDKAAKAKSGGAWVDYVWKKSTAEKSTPKTSFVKLCKGSDGTAWVAGSGIWKEDLGK